MKIWAAEALDVGFTTAVSVIVRIYYVNKTIETLQIKKKTAV